MKILVVCQYYYPENFQVTPICEQLVRDGYDVTVLTGLPNYPTGIIPDEYKKGHRDEIVNGVHVIRCFEIGRKKGAFSLALNYISYWYSASHKVGNLSDDFDLVFVYQLSPVMMGLPGLKYAKNHKIPLFLYCCDLWPESLKMYLHNENNPIFYLFKKISKKVYNSCERIAVQSTSFIRYMEETHSIPEDKIVYIPAFADETYLTSDFTPQDDIVDFVFLGNLGIAQNLIAVLQAVDKIKDVSNFKVHFVGDGTCLDEMKQFVKDKDLGAKVYFYGRRSVDEMPEFYKMADACLVSLKADNQTGLTLPAKVQGYMAAAKTIIGMIDGSAKEVIEEARCGLCVPAGDVDGLAEAMKEFIEHSDKYKDCGDNGRKYFINNFSKSIFMEKLEREINELGRKGNVDF
jgi:glycosyltransferase involved in cell wall biosynthesis